MILRCEVGVKLRCEKVRKGGVAPVSLQGRGKREGETSSVAPSHEEKEKSRDEKRKRREAKSEEKEKKKSEERREKNKKREEEGRK